ncbi:MAG TPA: EF-P lysine aminoacylase EpmA [Steroidobacteraceae bacterium]|nr:EF-P lysine aminoacylase EpmA [Steroidobacteraceae bacterium]
MPPTADDWRPTATRERLALRATLLARTRAFFAARAVLEVDTPVLVNAAVTDPHIHAVSVDMSGGVRPSGGGPAGLFVHTSPEYAMKRLLAAGVGDIYQICHVARGFEQSRIHNSEFTLVEWYRLGFDLGRLMDEVEELVRELCGAHPALRRPAERLSYREVFQRHAGLDPLIAAIPELRAVVGHLGLHGAARRDELLDLIMGAVIGPRLGHEHPVFVHGYPASQAALARLDPADPRTARRFELYAGGVELANGFQELAAPEEQRARFAEDLKERRRRGLPLHPMDERLLAALAQGLPECAGVAVGFDRVVMLAAGAAHIQEVLPFPTATA